MKLKVDIERSGELMNKGIYVSYNGGGVSYHILTICQGSIDPFYPVPKDEAIVSITIWKQRPIQY